MSEVVHLFVHARVTVGNCTVDGVSADVLPPKWFTKDPATSFEHEDLPQMLCVIAGAGTRAAAIGHCRSFFDWWQRFSTEQQSGASDAGIAPLLNSFAVSLMERAVLHAFCRATDTTLFRALQANLFEIELAAIRPELNGVAPADVLPSAPRSSVELRHTVGLGDAITADDITEESPSDGLPVSLVESIRDYGLRYFKIKLAGDSKHDLHRLQRLTSVCTQHVGRDCRVTLDGNENYSDLESFREHWELLRSETLVREFLDQALLFVEQPVHRRTALLPEVRQTLERWPDAPPLIIDESDADLTSLPTALALGYSGTSHKNCKGIIKSIANRASLMGAPGTSHGILSAEDLCNVGPVALLQDLAMVAVLGIEHVERNGHHYFAGLSMFAEEEQERVITHHSDLYTRRPNGLIAMAPRDGRVQLGSINAAPFGVVEPPVFDPAREWVPV